MKKNLFVLLFLLFLGGVVFVACQDELEAPPGEQMDNDVESMLKGITNPEIRKAIVWYGEHGPSSSLSRGTTGEHPLFNMMMPSWMFAFTREAKGHMISVEVPLRAHSRILFTLPENAIAYDETKNSMYIQSLTRLVILTDKETGVTNGFFMTLVPTKKYMDAKRFNVYRSTYFDRERDFDGYVYFHELDGSFANGWRYADGEITHKVRKAEDSGLTRSGGHYEYIRHCYPKYNRVCTGYWQTTESGGREYVEVNCYEEYAGEECYWETVWVPDPNPGTGDSGGTGGGGGGYDPDDKPKCPYGTSGCPGGNNCICCPVCMGPCKCEVCHSDPCGCIRDIKLTIKSSTTGEQAVVRIGMTTERYYVPLYNVVLEATDSTGNTIIENYVAIRFGVKSENNVVVVRGLQDEMTYTVSEFISAYCGESPSGDAWRVYMGHLLHAGPRDLESGCNMYGCIGICKGKMGELNRKLLLYSNAKTEQALASSGKFKIHVEAASKPPLVPKND